MTLGVTRPEGYEWGQPSFYCYCQLAKYLSGFSAQWSKALVFKEHLSEEDELIGLAAASEAATEMEGKMRSAENLVATSPSSF